MRIELRSETPEDTRGVGEAVASLLQPGDAIALTGELGAGKTTLVQGAARGLGVAGHVASPTFTLVREHPGPVPLFHVDVYRLDRIQDVLDLGLEEMVDGGGVVIVEWGDAIEELLPAGHLTIELTSSEVDDARRVVIVGAGPSWSARWERLEHLLEPWWIGP